MGKLREKIEEAGITPAKVGACLVVHEIIGEHVCCTSPFVPHRSDFSS